MIDYEMLPEHIRGGAKQYIEQGIEPGGFLSAVICNDLKGTMGKADDINRWKLFEIVSFFYCEAPSGCWGSPERFERWLDMGGLEGSFRDETTDSTTETEEVQWKGTI